MSKPVSIPSTFQNQSGPIPLSQLDNNFTQVAAAINDFGTYGNYLIDISGAANQLTVTTPANTTFTLASGVPIQVKVANATTLATVNINVNSLGNVLIVNADSSALLPGQFSSGQIVSLIYDGTNFRYLGASVSNGSFTGTLTGCTTSPTATFNWTKSGNIVVLTCGSSLTAVSNSTGCTVTGLPAIISPATSGNYIPCMIYNNSANTFGFAYPVVTGFLVLAVASVSGAVISFGQSGFTGSNNKGIPNGFSITYTVQ